MIKSLFPNSFDQQQVLMNMCLSYTRTRRGYIGSSDSERSRERERKVCVSVWESECSNRNLDSHLFALSSSTSSTPLVVVWLGLPIKGPFFIAEISRQAKPSFVIFLSLESINSYYIQKMNEGRWERIEARWAFLLFCSSLSLSFFSSQHGADGFYKHISSLSLSYASLNYAIHPFLLPNIYE